MQAWVIKTKANLQRTLGKASRDNLRWAIQIASGRQPSPKKLVPGPIDEKFWQLLPAPEVLKVRVFRPCLQVVSLECGRRPRQAKANCVFQELRVWPVETSLFTRECACFSRWGLNNHDCGHSTTLGCWLPLAPARSSCIHPIASAQTLAWWLSLSFSYPVVAHP